jgi:hypothetical protein
MKVGDLVKDNYPTRAYMNKVGVLMEQTRLGTSRLNKVFRVLWQDGTVGENVWDYDLKVVTDESRCSR